MRATRILFSLVSAIALIGLTAGPASAKKKAGVSMDDVIKVNGHQLVLNGMGLREATWLNIDVYVAGLYIPQRTSDPNAILGADEPKRLQLVFVRNVNRSDITDAWSEGFRKNVDKQTYAALGPRIKTLNGWMTKMHKRDILTFTYLPKAGTTVQINGQQLGVIPGRDFGRALFAIWLGSHPPNSGLKKGLLGK